MADEPNDDVTDETAEDVEPITQPDDRSDALARRLHTALVAATGKLIDPTDLPFDSEHLDDADKLAAAIDALIAAKPHTKARKMTGDAGLGHQGAVTPAVGWEALGNRKHFN